MGPTVKRNLASFGLIFTIAGLCLGLVLAGCGAGATKKVVVVGMLGDVETLNPILSENSNETEVMNGIFSTLLKMNDRLEMEPDLLTKMPELSPDRLTYTFQLRQGVKFHDGVELTAEDVEFLYRMKLAEGNLVPSRDMWEAIEKFEIIDKYNFRITLKKPDVTWLQGWCYGEGMIPPKHLLEKEFAASGGALTKGGPFSRHPVGTGPYMFVEWKRDQHILLKRNPHYFREGKPKIEKIVFKVIPDTNTMLAQFKKGEIDVLVGVNLLREGLDLPEVSLVAILDADKEGFLRSETSLIQTIGRAARNVSGEVVLYADQITASIKKAVQETNRRRVLQITYNKTHHITPKTVERKIADILPAEEVLNLEAKPLPKSRAALEKLLQQKEREMRDAAERLDFELAAILRDEIKLLNRKLK